MPTYLWITMLASLFFGTGAALMKHGMAAKFPKISLTTLVTDIWSIFKTLLQSKTWLLGNLINFGGAFCMIQAQSQGDLSVVLPLGNLTSAFAVLFGVMFMSEKLRGGEWTGLAVLVSGAVMIGLSASKATGEQGNMTNLVILTGAFCVAIALGLSSPRLFRWPSAEVAFALSAGLCMGLGFLYLKTTTNLINVRVGQFSVLSGKSWAATLTMWPVLMVIVTNVVGYLLMQAAFSHGRVSLANPLITVITNMSPALGGMLVFGERINMLRGAGIAVIAAGTLILALSGEKVKAAEPAALE